ncbi:MAG TPA: NAD(P)/FAD-dependent oxidoreductase [Acidimicrobiales bacterium]|nr:NAD(P)/FAD-dependent oxidoreductase [Acidimicrobiales bacterium]
MSVETGTPDAGTLVVGASAAGLACGSELQRLGQPFEIVEAGEAVAGAWRNHYDRLHLHTPKSTSALPGLAMPGKWDRYPARDQVVDYLERYQQHFNLRPHFGERVSRVEPLGTTWSITTSERVWRSQNVVIATGRTRVPVRPTWPGMEDFHGDVLHSSDYRNGDPWKGRTVLVVGFGNSACEQALDLVERGAFAHLSVRAAVNVVPRDLFGIPIVHLTMVMQHLPSRVADALSWPLLRISVGDVRDRGLRKLPYGPITEVAKYGRVPVLDIGTMEKITAGAITVHGGIERFTATGVTFVDGSYLAVDAVVLATGYRAAVDEFLVGADQVCDGSGTPLRSGQPSGLEGLYFCGMYVSPAGVLREIGIEARRIAREIAQRGAQGAERASKRVTGAA